MTRAHPPAVHAGKLCRVIADTAMGIFELAPQDPRWFRDPVVVGRALDAILDTPLGAMVEYAGVIRKAAKAPDRAAVHALVATGKEEICALQEAKKPKRMSIVLSIVEGALAVDARCYAPEIAKRGTVIDDLAAIGVALRDCGVFLGMREGFVRPLLQSYASYEHERTKPRAEKQHEGMLRPGAILDLIDARFHASDGPGADAAEARLARSKVPAWVVRTEKDGLVRLEWVKTLSDKPALDRACEAHEDWLDRHLPAGEPAPVELVPAAKVRGGK